MDSASQAAFYDPQGASISTGRILYVADTKNHAIRADRPRKSLDVITLAGTGEQARWIPQPVATRRFVATQVSPWDMVTRPATALYIAMAGFHQIWKMDLDSLNMRHPCRKRARAHHRRPARSRRSWHSPAASHL